VTSYVECAQLESTNLSLKTASSCTRPKADKATMYYNHQAYSAYQMAGGKLPKILRRRWSWESLTRVGTRRCLRTWMDMLTCCCWGFTMHKRLNCGLGWESPQQIVKLSILDLVITSDYIRLHQLEGNFPQWMAKLATVSGLVWGDSV